MKNYICLEDAIEALRKYQYPYGVEFLISNLPRCDVEPVVHAKWIEEKYETISTTRNRKINNTKNICPVCKKGNGRSKTNYCPHCGAKMDLTDD